MSDLIEIGEPRPSRDAGDAPVAPGPRTRKREPGPRPDWLRVRYQRGETFDEIERLKDGLNLHTVCEEARCPNIDECWSAGTATFMLMGEICTRRCGRLPVSPQKILGEKTHLVCCPSSKEKHHPDGPL